MRKFNKRVFLFGLIFCIMLIVGCVKFTTTPITPSQPSGAQEPLKEATPSQPPQATPSAAPPSVSPSPSTTTPTVQVSDISAVKCDGTTYNLVVKPNHELIEISIPINNEQGVLNLKSEGVVENIVEVAKNDGNTPLKLLQVYGSGGKASGSFLANWVILIADVKRDNLQTLYDKIKEKSKEGYGIHGLSSNYKEQDVILDYMCKVSIPKNTGRITLYSNIAEASFSVKGPAEYSGSGACWTKFDAPAGEYTITWNDVAGYTAPGKMPGFAGSTSQLRMTLYGEGHLKQGGNYRSDTQAESGMLIVITNLPEAKFTITGPASYSGSGTCWSQANVPLGQYQVVFDDVPGYEFPFSSLDKRQTAYVDASFLRTVDVEYKKIGEES